MKDVYNVISDQGRFHASIIRDFQKVTQCVDYNVQKYGEIILLNLIMKPILPFLLIASIGGKAQQDTVINYKDQGKIKSIEYSCQQGYFKHGTSELESYEHWVGCDDGVIQSFDVNGNKISEERNYINCLWSNTLEDSCRTMEYFDYTDGFLQHSIKWQIIQTSDTLEYSETFRYMTSDGIQTDSIFLNGDVLDRTFVMFFDTLENIFYIHSYLADSSFESHHTLWYDEAGRIVKEHYQTLGAEDYMPYEYTNYFEFAGNIRIEKVFFKDRPAGGTISEYNERGLVITENYLPIYENESEKSQVRTYKYIYDSHGNWIEKWIYQDGELIVIERRKITYYSE